MSVIYHDQHQGTGMDKDFDKKIHLIKHFVHTELASLSPWVAITANH